MDAFTSNGVKIYDLTVGKTLPEWLSTQQKRSLKKNLGFRNRIELIQDFHFPVGCTSLEYSPNEKYLVASGIYPPSIKLYELDELSVKVSRHIDSEVIKTKVLSDDYSKIAVLRNDRMIEFHAQYGLHYQTRVPKHARDMVYDYSNCDMLVVGDGSEIYRLNLERGIFLKPLASSCQGINACGINEINGLYCFGGEEGIAEFWDPRTRKPVAFLDVAVESQKRIGGFQDRSQISALQFDGHLNIAMGTSTGQVLLYDLRKNDSVQFKDHNYGVPIKKISFHKYNKTIISACKKIVKVWYPDTGKTFTSIEPKWDINDICISPDNGLLFVCTENPKICTYYVPDMGPAPEWSSWVDNLTQDTDSQNDDTVYQDYHFITEAELQNLGVLNLKGTPYLRAYMHGYFMDIRLYKKVRAMVETNNFDVIMKDKIKKRMDKRREGRIQLNTKMPSVNKEYVMRMIQANDKERAKIDSVITDDRFKDMFEEDEFKIDTEHSLWTMRHASDRFRKVKDIDEEFDRIDFQESDSGDSQEEIDDETNELMKELAEVKARNKVKFYEVKDNLNPIEKKDRNIKRQKSLKKKTFQERANDKSTESIDRVFGSISMTFVPEEHKTKMKEMDEIITERKKRNAGRRSMNPVLDPKAGKKKRRIK